MREEDFCIHIGRAQYKLLDAPVLIWDAVVDVTGAYFRRRRGRRHRRPGRWQAGNAGGGLAVSKGPNRNPNPIGRL